MSWFKRTNKNITTPVEQQKEATEGLFTMCSECKKIIYFEDFEYHAYTCSHCGNHEKIGSEEYFRLLFDGDYTEIAENLTSGNPLNFTDTKPYLQRIKESQEKTNLKDALRVAYGKLSEKDWVVAVMDFNFIGGSMGSVVGEKIARGMDYSLKHKIPFLMISRSGGARMMEAGFSLMQMAKTSAKIALLGQSKIPYISLLTNPTTGGVTASFAMLGDFNIAEPKALIGFAGPRVIKETIGKDLPVGFQSAEFVLEHGFLDFIVHRKELKKRLTDLLKMITPK